MSSYLTLDVKPDNIEASLGSLLVLQKLGFPVFHVELTKKDSNPNNPNPNIYTHPGLNYNRVFNTLGSFQLVKLSIKDTRGFLSCQMLATAIHATRPSLKNLWLENVALTGDAEGLIRALQDHPCLTSFEWLRDRTQAGFPHASFIRSLNTCPLLGKLSYFAYDDAEGIGPVLTSLCCKSSLRVLQLIPGSTLKLHVPSICQVLQKNTTLRKLFLNLRYGDVAQPAFESIGKMLEKNTALNTLELYLGDQALSMIGPVTNALKSRNKSITCFVLATRHREAKDWPLSTVKALEDLITENIVLKDVQYGSRRAARCAMKTGVWEPPASAKIAFYLKLNNLDRHSFLKGKPSMEEWANTIISNREDASVVFYLLSGNPSFLQSLSLSNAFGNVTSSISSEDVPRRPLKQLKVVEEN